MYSVTRSSAILPIAAWHVTRVQHAVVSGSGFFEFLVGLVCFQQTPLTIAMGVNKSADQQLHNRAQRSGAAPATLAGQLFRDDRDFQDAIAASLENQQGIDTIESVGLLRMMSRV
ncbi:hypothetical protein [Brachymonas sp. G13]|uniref:hypothetical protein n=1 Tax=Brachymonas wangyanguii TaxID=3130163 RepID=UPI00386C5442